eukprot:TRINITY_DN26291_c0_g1_i1.p1 TRINITY_DN26291_c0_g1~~TRINITY_DN26291_c0_g1_i1.p1  ORF type:complete len:1029 (+),score=206.62 TRINITY_DN26291_c0_g1_i1:66-3089(+)
MATAPPAPLEATTSAPAPSSSPASGAISEVPRATSATGGSGGANASGAEGAGTSASEEHVAPSSFAETPRLPPSGLLVRATSADPLLQRSRGAAVLLPGISAGSSGCLERAESHATDPGGRLGGKDSAFEGVRRRKQARAEETQLLARAVESLTQHVDRLGDALNSLETRQSSEHIAAAGEAPTTQPLPREDAASRASLQRALDAITAGLVAAVGAAGAAGVGAGAGGGGVAQRDRGASGDRAAGSAKESPTDGWPCLEAAESEEEGEASEKVQDVRKERDEDLAYRQRVLQVLERLEERLGCREDIRHNEAQAMRQRLSEENLRQTQALGEMVVAVHALHASAASRAPLDRAEGAEDTSEEQEAPRRRSKHAARRRSSSSVVSISSGAFSQHRSSEGGICEFPEVQVSLKIYQLSNVNTAQMTFEIDFLCRLDWCDPSVEGIPSEELETLDWTQYFDPCVEIDNAKESCGWLPGADGVPRRPGSRGRSSGGAAGPWLRKTMRFRGTLSLISANLKCFPFDVQVLPVKLKAARCRGLGLPVGTPAAAASGGREEGHRVRLVDARGLASIDAGYLEASPHMRARGHYAVQAADESLLEFNVSALAGCHPEPKRRDVYQVNILIERPRCASYVWDVVIMNVLVALSATAFWDTAAPELSSRMSISLTVILTLAAYTSSRPAPIEKAPYVTFHDWCEQVCMLLVTGISIQNVFAVVTCGGQHEEAPPHMVELFERSEELCSVGWCLSRQIDCRALLLLLAAWLVLMAYSFIWLLLNRRATRGQWSRLLSISCGAEQSESDDEAASRRRGAAASSLWKRWRPCCCWCHSRRRNDVAKLPQPSNLEHASRCQDGQAATRLPVNSPAGDRSASMGAKNVDGGIDAVARQPSGFALCGAASSSWGSSEPVASGSSALPARKRPQRLGPACLGHASCSPAASPPPSSPAGAGSSSSPRRRILVLGSNACAEDPLLPETPVVQEDSSSSSACSSIVPPSSPADCFFPRHTGYRQFD